MQGKLTITQGKNQGVCIDLPPDCKITIGRGKRCSLVLEDSKVSSVHCQIALENGRFWLKDLASTNGTILNGNRIESAVLADKDRIKVGQSAMVFEMVADNATPEQEEYYTEITQLWDEEPEPQPTEEYRTIKDYRLIETQSLATGIVEYKAEHLHHKDIVSLKIIPCRRTITQIEQNHINNGLRVVRAIHNLRIVSLLDFFWQNQQLILVSEYIQGKSLQQWIKNKKKLSAIKALKVALHITAALGYLHSKQLCHSGMMAANVFIEEGTNCIKLQDAAVYPILAAHLATDDWDYEIASYYPAAKEQLDQVQADIYALGCLIFLMLTGELPGKEGPEFSLPAKTAEIPPLLAKILHQAMVTFEFSEVRECYRAFTKTLHLLTNQER